MILNFFFAFLILSPAVVAQFSNAFLGVPGNTMENTVSVSQSTPSNSPQWVTIQSVEWTTPAPAGLPRAALPPVKLNIDQVRNGTGAVPNDPVIWQNGNAGGSNAHYVEGWSIPYRVVITNLPLNGTQFVDIEWDIRHSGKNAIDFITDFDLINFPVGSHALNFNHPQEEINPLSGYETTTFVSSPFDSDNLIPMPNLPAAPPAPGASGTFSDISTAGKAHISIWNGDITDLAYVSQGDLNGGSSSTRLRIYFTNTAGTVIIAWGGHIAKATDWGSGNSASAVSGSPYHTRLIAWDPDGDGLDITSIGNQDRSLSADAVIDPPPCDVTGPGPVCPGTSGHVYQNNAAANPAVIPSGFTYLWSVTGNGSISGANNGATVTVNAGSTCNSPYTVTLTINTTNGLFITSCQKVVQVTDTTPPSLTCPAAVTVSCPANVPAPNINSVTGVSDNCGGTVSVTYRGDQISNQTCANRYTITRTYRATDVCGNYAECTQTITVNDQTAPSLTCPANVTVSCASQVPAPNTASVTGVNDNCSGTVTVTHQGDVISNQTCANRYTITRTYRATDVCGNYAECTQTITVNDQTPPTLTCPAAITVSCASQVPAPNPASVTGVNDNCGGTVTVTHQGDVISNQTCPNRYTITRTYRATDACGNFNDCTQTITVNDQTAPSLTCPANVTVSCASQVPAPNPASVTGVNDNCGGTVTVTHQGDVISNQTCANRYTITRTYRATDACGNFNECTQLITVNDQTNPTLTCPANVTVSCASQVPAANINSVTGVNDNCGGTVTVTHQGDVISNQTCANRYTLTRTYRATDACGNFTECSQIITVNDQTAPVITCPPDRIVECGASTAPTAQGTGLATATDNCGTVTVTWEDVSSTVGCQTLITRTWTATDACGLTASCVQRIQIRDRTAPVITCLAGGTATATDNCTPQANITLFLSNGVWTAIDESGNYSTCNQLASRSAPAAINEAVRPVVPGEQATVKAYPNPFNDQVRFVVTTPTTVNGSLEVFNLLGQRIKTVYKGLLPAGQNTFELQIPGRQIATLVYVFRTADQQLTGKLIQVSTH